MQIQPPDPSTPLWQYAIYAVAVIALALHVPAVKRKAARMKAMIFTSRSPQPSDPTNPQ